MMINFIRAKKSYQAKAAMGFAVVCIAILSGCQDEPPQVKAALPLNNLTAVPAPEDTCTAVTNAQNSKIVEPKIPSDNTPLADSLQQWHRVRMCVTAYCPCPICCGRLAAGITANGHVIRRGDRFIAAPKRYSFGTEIIVPPYNNARPIKVLDRGGAIKGNHLDIFFPSHAQAVRWGVKYLDVKVRVVS